MSTSAKDIVVDVAPPTSTEPADIIAWAQRVVENLMFQLNNGIPRIRYREMHTVPSKPREGDVFFADGVDWNPGSGQGFYGYYGGAFHFLG